MEEDNVRPTAIDQAPKVAQVLRSTGIELHAKGLHELANLQLDAATVIDALLDLAGDDL